MITRSKANYSGIDIKNLIALQCNSNSNSNTTKTKKQTQSQKQSQTVLGNFMLFDVECFEMSVKDPISNVEIKKWIPHQIAWGVYNSNDNMKCLEQKNYYVSELWVNSKYRTNIVKQYKESFKKHMDNVLNNQYPMKSGRKIITKMLDHITQHNIKTIVAYNIHTDFESFKNLVTYIPSNVLLPSSFDCKYTNPFNKKVNNYCDLMHNVAILYMDYLIDEGLKDEKIFRNARTKRIKLCGRDNSKSIYSAEYILHKFFNDKQPHTADEDVKLELKILKKIINDFTEKELELNVMYTCKLYELFANKITNEHAQQVKTASLYKQSNNQHLNTTPVVNIKQTPSILSITQSVPNDVDINIITNENTSTKTTIL